MAVKFLNGIDVDGSMNLHSDDIPNLNASKVTGGTFSTSRIPNLSASKITSGTINAARLPDLSGTYQPAGNYLTSIPSEYLTQTEGDARYLELGGGSISGPLNVLYNNHPNGTGWDNNLFIGSSDDSGLAGSFPTYVPSGSYGFFSHAYSDGVFIGSVPVSAGATNYYATIAWGDDATEYFQFLYKGTQVAKLDTIGRLYTYGGNSEEWNTAYGWGNHASAGYLTSLPSHSHSWSSITSKPSTFTPSAHTHTIANVTGLQSALDSKQGSGNYATFTNNIYLNDSATTADFIAELTNEHGAFQDNYRVYKVAWSYAGNSNLNVGFETIELAGCLVECWGGTYKHVRVTRPTTGTGGRSIYVYNDQGSTYAPGWRQIWTSDEFSSTNVSNWNTAYGWGNHAGLYDGAGAADAVNNRIDSEIIPAIQTPAITSNGSTPSLNSGISAGEIRGLIGAQPSGTYNTIIGTDSDINTSGATIVDNIYVTDGVITSMGTRTLTLGNLGFTGATNANYITNNNQLTNGAGYITSADGGNADTVDGKHASTTRNSANTIPVRDGNGYLNLGWINTTSGNTTSTLTDIYVNTNDGYIRKATPAHFRSQITNGHYDTAGSAAAVQNNLDNLAGSLGSLALEDSVSISDVTGLQTALNGKLGTGAKAADSNLLDGINSTSFLRSDANDTHSGQLALTSITAASGTIANTKGSYLHVGAWGTGRTAVDAVLVNTAYRSDILSYTRSFTIGNTARNFNGSGNVSWSLADIGAEAAGAAASVENSLQPQVDNALSVANTAQTTADNAQGTADTALTRANSALASIPTNNNQLTNGAGYVTATNHNHNSIYSQLGHNHDGQYLGAFGNQTLNGDLSVNGLSSDYLDTGYINDPQSGAPWLTTDHLGQGSTYIGNPMFMTGIVMKLGSGMTPKIETEMGISLLNKTPNEFRVQGGVVHGAGEALQIAEHFTGDDGMGYNQGDIYIGSAGLYEVSYSVTFRSNYANRSCFGLVGYSPVEGTYIRGSRNVQYFRYSTYGQYTTISGTFYWSGPAGGILQIRTELLSGSASHQTFDSTNTRSNMIYVKQIREN